MEDEGYRQEENGSYLFEASTYVTQPSRILKRLLTVFVLLRGWHQHRNEEAFEDATLLCAEGTRSGIVRVMGDAHPNAVRDGEGTDDET